jgi:hypothetical protein
MLSGIAYHSVGRQLVLMDVDARLLDVCIQHEKDLAIFSLDFGFTLLICELVLRSCIVWSLENSTLRIPVIEM